MVRPTLGVRQPLFSSDRAGLAMSGKDARDGRDDASGAAAEGDLSGRLERLGVELEARRPASQPGSSRGAPSSDPSALARALRASTEFVAGILVGGGLGWAIDKGLGTSPWGLIVFVMLGFAAGIVNVLRSAGLPTGGGPARGRDEP